MCKSAEEIRKTDYTCIALDEYIQHRKKSVNGDKESLAYFDVLRAEAEIQNRIITLQTQEDMLDKFEKAEDARASTDQKLVDVATSLDLHLADCKNNPNAKKMMQEEPLKFWAWVTGINLAYFVVLHFIQYWIGFEQMVKNLFNLIPGVDIP